MLTDGTSVSVGTHSRGALRHGATLPFRGDGYLIPRRWQDRGRNHGTEELVTLLVRSARRVHRDHRGGVLGIADLGLPGGGATPEHRSHYSGRDVDIIYYATDLRRKPLVPTRMFYFDRHGNGLGTHLPSATRQHTAAPASTTATDTPQPQPRRLDLARNWSLVRTLVTDPRVPVQWIFMGRPIIRMLLSHAKRKREPKHIIQRAAAVLHQPSDAQSHMDHAHIRVFCSLSDRRQGCVDRGPQRWFKKSIKYVDAPPRHAPLPPGLARLSLKNLYLRGL